MAKGHILIVDGNDDVATRIRDVLLDAGYSVSRATEGRQALALIMQELPDVILMDIWLPGMDGIETLHHIRQLSLDLKIIIMSNHGNIETAVAAMRQGAFDYIQKPMPPSEILHPISRALPQREVGRNKHLFSPRQLDLAKAAVHVSQTAALDQHIPQRATGDSPYRLRRRPPGGSGAWQKTLHRSAVLYGLGLQSGIKTGLILSPLPPHSGIVFSSITSGERIPASIKYIESTDFSTSLRKGRFTSRTIEHLLSALHAYRISNLLVKITDEVPIMDGSAAAFCQLIEQTGIREQPEHLEEFVVTRCFHMGTIHSDAKYLLVEPYNGLRITYRLHYPPPLGIQEFTYEHVDASSYWQEIAPARTFSFVSDIEKMHNLDLLAGGRLNNAILLDGEKIVNSTQLRFPEECARHKVLDLMGDLYLLGKPIKGYIRANLTGHTENVALVQKLYGAMRNGQ